MKAVFSVGRRQFLLGTAGASLALPLLPSLLSRGEAQAALASTDKCFAYFQLPHGAVLEPDMYPADALATDSMQYAGHAIRRGDLSSNATGETKLSAVLRAPATELTPGLLAKMNVIRGVDLPHYPAHGGGHTLGNFAEITGGAIDEGINWNRPTIDQIMAFAPGFYSSVPAQRVIVNGELSWQNADPMTRAGALKQVPPFAGSNIALFDQLFGMVMQTPSGAPDTRLVDKVFENYKRLRSSGKLSAVDARRLDEHLQRIAELQGRLSRPLAGANVTRPTIDSLSVRGSDDYIVNPLAQIHEYQLWNDIIAAAFSVGACRIAVNFAKFNTFSTWVGDWHDLAHSSEGARREAFAEANQKFFQGVVLDLARKLDGVVLADGRSVLDASLVAWSQESGSYSHYGVGVPIVTFGSAAGALKTGQYLDYRNLNKVLPPAATEEAPSLSNRWHGLVWHQWLGTVLEAMGVPATAYDGLKGGKGYPTDRPSDITKLMTGDPIAAYPGSAPAYPDSVWNAAATESLPWMKA